MGLSRLRAVGALVAGIVATAGVLTAPVSEAEEPRRATATGTRGVVFVGNNWEGTATLVDPVSFRRLGTLDVVPDYQERMQEIATNKLQYA